MYKKKILLVLWIILFLLSLVVAAYYTAKAFPMNDNEMIQWW